MENNTSMTFSAPAINHPSGVFVGYNSYASEPVFCDDFVVPPYPNALLMGTLGKANKAFFEGASTGMTTFLAALATLGKVELGVFGKTHTGMTTYLLSMSNMAKLPQTPKEPPTLREVVEFMNLTQPPKLGPLPHPGGCWKIGSVDEHIFVCESATELRLPSTKLDRSVRGKDIDQALRNIVRRYFQNLNSISASIH